MKPSELIWTATQAPRIWRCTHSRAGGDEPLQAPASYTDDVLAGIAAAGFTGIWLFCKLYDLMRSSVFPELDDSRADARLAGIQTVVERGRKYGIGVYLYFNDPVGLDVDHPFWKAHTELRGVELWHRYALCTSTPAVRDFFRDAVGSIGERLRGVAGVFLITACESLTHCWSKTNRRRGQPPPNCPRCRDREPADIVLELLDVWAEARRRQPAPFRLMAWNWEWAYWYPDPQAPIVTRLPEGVELLVDLEIGGTRPWGRRTNYIGEYALGYVGPSERFVATRQAAAARATPVHAKIQINNTHELCTVPNVPLLQNLHGKWRALRKQRVAGFLGCWSIGSQFTLNTYALRLFMQDPQRFTEPAAFLAQLATEYFGACRTAAVLRAWQLFCDAFASYPFSVNLLYLGPHNDAPARRLSLFYRGQPAGRSFMPDEPGDDFARCLEAHKADGERFTLDEVIEGYTRMCANWDAGLASYVEALDEAPPADGEYGRHRQDELRCARMIGSQLRSALNVFLFYREQQRLLKAESLAPPCRLPPVAALLSIMRAEIANAEGALPLVAADLRLGFHEEFQGYKYNAALIRAKLAAMRAELAETVK
jgi:hypothetical protein